MTAGDSDAAQKSKLDREIPIPAGNMTSLHFFHL